MLRRVVSMVGVVLMISIAAGMSPGAQAPSAGAATWAKNGTDSEEWTRTFPPFRIVGNLYWVGGYDLSTYLITTPQGHILINTGVGDTAQQIAASVSQLGFKMSDVRILTATHGHIDHVAGLAELKRTTGAAVVIAEPDQELLETGGRADFLLGKQPSMQFEPVTVDRTVKDGEKIALGGTELTAHLTAGHTRGATSFTLTVPDGGRTYRVVIANMPSINGGTKLTGMPGYPGIGPDYAKAFLALKDMKIDIWLASHASQFRLHEKYTPGAAYDPNRFVDPAGFLEAVRKLEQTYLDQLEKDRSGR